MSGILVAVYFSGLLLAVAIRTPHELGRRRNRITDRRVGWLEAVLIVLVVPSMVPPSRRLCADALAGFCGLPAPALGRSFRDRRLRGRAVAVLEVARRPGRNFSPTLHVRADHTLVVHGVYRRVRHPMYAAQWLWGIAQALLVHNWVAGFSGLVLSVLLYLLRIPREERMMAEHFGEKYRSYTDQTGRILPRPGRIADSYSRGTEPR